MLVRPATGQQGAGERDVASASEPAVQIEVSSFEFHGKKAEEHKPCPLNHGADAHDVLGPCHWSSNPFQHLPQWVWIHFPAPRRIDTVVLHAVTMASRPIELSGQSLSRDGSVFQQVFHVQNADYDARTLTSTIHFAPVITDNLRLVIEKTAATATPQSWIAQLAQVQVFGSNAEAAATAPLKSWPAMQMPMLRSTLVATSFAPKVEDTGNGIAISTPWYRLVLDKQSPRILFLAMDSLGKGELAVNLLQQSGAYAVLDEPFRNATAPDAGALKHKGNLFEYAPVQIAPGAYERVTIRASEKGFDLELTAAANRIVTMRGGVFRFQFAANQTPTTFVCQPSKLTNYVDLPTYLTAPDFGTAYISRTADAAAFYRRPSSLFPATSYAVDITPHQPRSEDGLNKIGLQPWHTTLHFAVQAPVPLPDIVKSDPRLARFAKYSLNMVQWRPDTGIVSNSVMSINCPLALLFYAEQAVFAPPLQNGISPMALVGASVDRYFDGERGYMMSSMKNVFTPDWTASRETPAYLVISAWYVIRTIGGMSQAHAWLTPMEAVANRIESRFGADGLVYEPGREWFDTYDFQGADAYSNAADYRALLCMADVERLEGRPALATRYRADAERIKSAYFKAFFNPATGVLAGWRSLDGKLHDYMFPWVNGFAIYQGLVPEAQARAILRIMLTKMDSIGFHSYQYGLPTNLIPMSPADYVPRTSGAPKQPDGMDTWQIYMNGAATPPYEYYFLQALYQTGQYQEAERLLWPLMGSYEAGTFNAGIELPGEKQRNPVGSAFYVWDGSRGRGEGYLPEDWQGMNALFTGHFGIGFDEHGYYLAHWSPLKGTKVKLELPYMGRKIQFVEQQRAGWN